MTTDKLFYLKHLGIEACVPRSYMQASKTTTLETQTSPTLERRKAAESKPEVEQSTVQSSETKQSSDTAAMAWFSTRSRKL